MFVSFVFFSALNAAQISKASSKPNFLILFADDLGYGDLACNGNPTTQTPHLTHLAEEGMVFTQWYSGFHVCSPSRAAMLTGRLPIRSGCAGTGFRGGVFSNMPAAGLPQNETTFATILKEQGYRTKMVGKWHLGTREGFLPTDHGFDEYVGVPYSVDMGESPWWHEYAQYPPLPLVQKSQGSELSFMQQPVDLTTLSKVYTQEALSFIEEKSDAPFLLYFAFNHVHIPNFVSPKFCNTTRRGQFGDALAEMDDVIGKVMAEIRANHPNTLTFFTSDNGPWLPHREQGGNAGPFRDGKSSCWEGGYREPGIVHWPGVVPSGSVSYEVVSTMDIFSTIVKLGGGSIPTDRIIDGKDMYPIMKGTGESQHEAYYFWGGASTCGDENKCPGLWAVRSGPYKMHWVSLDSVKGILSFHDPPLLFNIEQDLSERLPISNSTDEYKQLRPKIEQLRLDHIKSVRPVPNQMAKGSDEKYALCCDPDSQDKYPKYPKCTCTPDGWTQKLCLRTL